MLEIGDFFVDCRVSMYVTRIDIYFICEFVLW